MIFWEEFEKKEIIHNPIRYAAVTFDSGKIHQQELRDVVDAFQNISQRKGVGFLTEEQAKKLSEKGVGGGKSSSSSDANGSKKTSSQRDASKASSSTCSGTSENSEAEAEYLLELV